MGKKTPEQWQFIAGEHYKFYRDRAKMSTDGHIGYAKWLLATLLAVHGGAIIAISQLGANAGKIFAVVGLWFLTGLMLAIASGFCAWLNFHFCETAYEKWANPGMVFDNEDWPSGNFPHGKKVTFTLWSAGILGIGSWLCIAGGALALFSIFAKLSECGT